MAAQDHPCDVRAYASTGLRSATMPIGGDDIARGRSAALRTHLREREIPCLHGFRGLAALSVAAYHGLSPRFPGPAAVAAFFVLSGFLITWILLGEEDRTGSVSLPQFWIRRAFRILPAFYVFWLVQVMTYGAARGAAVSSAFYAFNYWQLSGSGLSGPFGHTWSLAVEEQFYLVWPIAFVFMHDRVRLVRWFIVCAVGIQCARLILTGILPFQYTYATFEMRADALLVGCATAIYIHSGGRIPNWLLHPVFSVPALVLLVVSGWGENALRQSAHLGAAIATWASLLLMLQAIAARPRWLDNSPMRFLGLISYSVYLYHVLMIRCADSLGLQFRYTLPLRMVLTVVAASLSYVLIERPALQLKGKITMKRRAVTVVV